MRSTIDTTETCPYCGKTFYLPSDCEEHVKVTHLDFGPRIHISLDADLTGDPSLRVAVARSRWKSRD